MNCALADLHIYGTVLALQLSLLGTVQHFVTDRERGVPVVCDVVVIMCGKTAAALQATLAP